MTAQVHSWEKAKGRRSITVESVPNMCAAMMMVSSLIRSATTTNGSKDVLGSYAHCTETTRRHGQSSVQTVLQQECTNLQFAANQRCSQVHVARANYQACIWHNSLEAAAHMPSPHGHGWDVIDGHISIHCSSLHQRHSCNSSVATASKVTV